MLPKEFKHTKFYAKLEWYTFYNYFSNIGIYLEILLKFRFNPFGSIKDRIFHQKKFNF